MLVMRLLFIIEWESRMLNCRPRTELAIFASRDKRVAMA